MGSLLLGIDVGTYSSKGVLVDPGGALLKSHVVQHKVDFPHPGWAEQDADAIWWADVVAICNALLDGAPYSGEDVAGVGLSAMGPCLLALDVHNRPLRPGILYGIDTRASDEIAWLNDHYGADAIYEVAGMALTTQSVGPKTLWLRRHEPDVWSQTTWVTTASSYLTFRMTGEKVIDRRTASHYAPLLDIYALEWSPRLASEIIDRDRLPRLGWSSEIAGQVSPEAAAETGLLAGTPVAVGGIDGLSEALSVGVVRPGDLMLMYASTTFFNLVLDRPIPDRRTWLTGGAFPGSYNMAAGMATTGTITRWFVDQFAPDMTPDEAYAALFEQGAQIEPGAGGLLMLPYFSGERSPIHDPHARGVIAGLTLSHTRAHLFRAILEGVAYGVRHNLEAIRSTGASIERVVAVGGGTQTPLWLQIVSDVTGITQEVPALTIGASYGDAFLAGHAAGLLTRDDLDTWVKPGQVIGPNEATRERYEALYADYLGLYGQTRDIVHRLAQGNTA
jgi:xylulokinase